MKIDRLLAIVTILLQQDKVTAPELAEQFEVSRRTINRDVENICKAGIPLITTQGYGGGISIADGYRIDKSLLTGDELQTILAALKGIDTISSTPYLTNFSKKLFRKDNRFISENIFVIDLASHYQKPLTEKIEDIKNAIQNNRYITFKYYSKKGEQQRKLEPYRLVFQWSSWYVFGYCLDSNAYRLFKLNRLCKLSILNDQFTCRLIKTEDLNFGTFLEVNDFHLKAFFAESEKYRLIDEYGIDSYSVDKNGMLLFEWDFANYENMRDWIFSFGDKVVVLEPNTLVEDRINNAKNILKMHDKNSNANFQK